MNFRSIISIASVMVLLGVSCGQGMEKREENAVDPDFLQEVLANKQQLQEEIEKHPHWQRHEWDSSLNPSESKAAGAALLKQQNQSVM